MTSIFDDITSFFSGPSVAKCSKEEKKENDKHDAKVNEENERHKAALLKIKETASCKLKPTDFNEEPKQKPETQAQEPLKTQEPAQAQLNTQDGVSTNDSMLDFNEQKQSVFGFDKKEPQKPEQQAGGRKRRTRRPRKRSGKGTRRPH